MRRIYISMIVVYGAAVLLPTMAEATNRINSHGQPPTHSTPNQFGPSGAQTSQQAPGGGAGNPQHAVDPITGGGGYPADPTGAGAEARSEGKGTEAARNNPNDPSSRADPGPRTADLDSRPRGYATLGEYLTNGTKLLAEQAKAVEKLRKLEKLMAQYAARHQQLAQEFRRNSNTGASTAKNMGSIPDLGSLAASQAFQAPVLAPPAPAAPIAPLGANEPKQASLGRRIEAPEALSPEKIEKLTTTKTIPTAEAARAPASLRESEISSSIPAAFTPAAQTAAANPASTIAVGKADTLPSSNGSKAAPKGPSLRDQLRQKLAQQGAERERVDKNQEQQLAAASQATKASGGAQSHPEGQATQESVVPQSAFSMKGSETDAAIQRLAGEVNTFSSLPGAESLGLFLRVHSAHERWKKQVQ